MNFQNAPLIQTTVLGREARVSETRCRSVVELLKSDGTIETVKTPTGREFLTVAHAEIVFQELVGERRGEPRAISL